MQRETDLHQDRGHMPEDPAAGLGVLLPGPLAQLVQKVYHNLDVLLAKADARQGSTSQSFPLPLVGGGSPGSHKVRGWEEGEGHRQREEAPGTLLACWPRRPLAGCPETPLSRTEISWQCS